MNSRDRIQTIIKRESADRCGFWLGNPYDDTWPILPNIPPENIKAMAEEAIQ
jgi:hypothetical protein